VELRTSDIDLKRKTVTIRARAGWGPKTESGERTIPLNDRLAKTLRPLVESARRGGGYVCATRDGRKRANNLHRRFKTEMRAALYSLRGIPTRKNLSRAEKQKHAAALEDAESELARLDIHSLRYTFITELISAGTDPKTVQRLAGHKDIQTTLGIYAQCRDGNATEAVAKLPW